MKKMMRIFAPLLAAALTLCLIMPGCSSAEKKPQLRICFDIGTLFDANNSINQQAAAEGFRNYLSDFVDGVSAEDIVLEVVPSDASQRVEREAVLQRLRTEIMSGSGPDIFISMSSLIDAHTGEFTKRLFPYVEKAIEDGVFLPLDEYIASSDSELWSGVIPAVLEGGKNRRGEQVLVPMTFMLPVTVTAAQNASAGDFAGAGWLEAVRGEDPILAEQIRWLWPEGSNPADMRSGEHAQGMGCIFPPMFDFSSGAILMDEEEMAAAVSEAIAAYKAIDGRDSGSRCVNVFFSADEGAAVYLNKLGNTDRVIAPLRNTDGGTTTVVCEFCAVSAGTRRPDDAFAILEALLSEGYRNGGMLYLINRGLPVSLKAPAPGSRYLDLEFDEWTAGEWQAACAQINRVYYPSEMDLQLNEMMLEIRKTMQDSYEPERPDYPVFSDLLIPFIGGTIEEDDLREIVHRHYEAMERLIGES